MSRNACTILLLLACAAITVALLQLKDSKPSELEMGSSAEPGAEIQPGLAGLDEVATGQEPAPAGTSVERTSAAEGPMLSGKVRWPEATPADEQLWVELEGSQVRTRVLASGEFALLLPAGTKTGALLLDGIYLYLPDPVPFNMADSLAITLEPVLGACIAVQVELPASLPGEEPLPPGVSVEWSTSGAGTTRTSSLGASSTVLLRALPTQRDGRVRVLHAGLYNRYRGPIHVTPGQRLNLRFDMIRGVPPAPRSNSERLVPVG